MSLEGKITKLRDDQAETARDDQAVRGCDGLIPSCMIKIEAKSADRGCTKSDNMTRANLQICQESDMTEWIIIKLLCVLLTCI